MTTTRPAEHTALLLIAAAVYGFLAERGVPHAFAAIVGLVVGLAPLAVSLVKDLRDDQPDRIPPHDPDAPSEQHELSGVPPAA